MDILIFALVVLIVCGLVIYLIDLLPMDGRLALAAKILVVIIAILLLVSRAGLI